MVTFVLVLVPLNTEICFFFCPCFSSDRDATFVGCWYSGSVLIFFTDSSGECELLSLCSLSFGCNSKPVPVSPKYFSLPLKLVSELMLFNTDLLSGELRFELCVIALKGFISEGTMEPSSIFFLEGSSLAEENDVQY